MKYKRYRESAWVNTGLKCPRDGAVICSEELNGLPIGNFCCENPECYDPHKPENHPIHHSQLSFLAQEWLTEFKSDPLCHPPFPETLFIPFASETGYFSQEEVVQMKQIALDYFRSPVEWCPRCRVEHRQVESCLDEWYEREYLE